MSKCYNQQETKLNAEASEICIFICLLFLVQHFLTRSDETYRPRAAFSNFGAKGRVFKKKLCVICKIFTICTHNSNRYVIILWLCYMPHLKSTFRLIRLLFCTTNRKTSKNHKISLMICNFLREMHFTKKLFSFLLWCTKGSNRDVLSCIQSEF